MSIELHEFEDRQSLAEALSDAVLHALQYGLNTRGFAFLAVSGGSTPAVFFQELSNRPFSWDRVSVTLVDERWVPEQSARSNAGAVRRTLLTNAAAAATFRGLHNDAPTPEEGARETWKTAGGIAEFLDIAVLGMGTDGHTASLFPKGDNLDRALDPRGKDIFLPMNVPGLDEARITLTLPVLLRTTSLILHIEGAEKRAVLERALQDGPVEEMPVRALVRHDQKPISVFWAP